MHWPSLLLVQLALFAQQCFALSNVTVDDSGTDPITGAAIQYTSGWNIGPECRGCQAQPDRARAYNGTWHDATYDKAVPGNSIPHNATFRFTGSAVYVYGIVSHSSTFPVSDADIHFYIDGELSGALEFTPTGENEYTFDVPLYANDSLEYALHVVTLQDGRIGGNSSLVLLDYIVYSTNETIADSSDNVMARTTSPVSFQSPSPDSTRSPERGDTPARSMTSTQIILLATLPPSFFVLVTLVLLWYIFYRRRRRQYNETHPIELTYNPLISFGCGDVLPVIQPPAPAVLGSDKKRRTRIATRASQRDIDIRDSGVVWIGASRPTSLAQATTVSSVPCTQETLEGKSRESASAEMGSAILSTAEQQRVDDQRLRAKIQGEISRFGRNAVERRAQVQRTHGVGLGM